MPGSSFFARFRPPIRRPLAESEAARCRCIKLVKQTGSHLKVIWNYWKYSLEIIYLKLEILKYYLCLSIEIFRYLDSDTLQSLRSSYLSFAFTWSGSRSAKIGVRRSLAGIPSDELAWHDSTPMDNWTVVDITFEWTGHGWLACPSVNPALDVFSCLERFMKCKDRSAEIASRHPFWWIGLTW